MFKTTLTAIALATAVLASPAHAADRPLSATHPDGYTVPDGAPVEANPVPAGLPACGSVPAGSPCVGAATPAPVAQVAPVSPMVAGTVLDRMIIAKANGLATVCHDEARVHPDAPKCQFATGRDIIASYIGTPELIAAAETTLDQHVRNCLFLGVARGDSDLINRCSVPAEWITFATTYEAALQFVQD
jgi:hypothetical protein